MRGPYQAVYALAMAAADGPKRRKHSAFSPPEVDDHDSHASPPARHWLATILTLAIGFGVGVATGAGCATSDQVLEKQRRLEEMEGGGKACHSGVTEDCYSGPQGTAGRGACKIGQRACEDERWGACQNEVVPIDELCNQVDDDCDGIVDNGFEREGALCFFKGAKGACRSQGKWHCSDDATSSYCDAPVVKPKPETCNAIDDDCDGETDEDSVPQDKLECTTGKAGVCAAGTNTCVNGKIRCVQKVQPGIEICNKLDDNCNASVDEDCISEEEARKQGLKK